MPGRYENVCAKSYCLVSIRMVPFLRIFFFPLRTELKSSIVLDVPSSSNFHTYSFLVLDREREMCVLFDSLSNVTNFVVNRFYG